MWIFGLNLKVSPWCDDLRNKKNPTKYIFSAYGDFLSKKKDVFFKSNPLKMWNFGLNLKVLFWCDDLKNKKNPKKYIFLVYGDFLAEKQFFFNQNRWGCEVSI